MQVTVTSLDTGNVFILDVPEDLEVQNLKALCEVESGIPASNMRLIINGVPLTDNKKSMKSYGIKNNDMIVLERSHATLANRSDANPMQLSSLDFRQIKVPQCKTQSISQNHQNEEDPAVIRDMLRANPHQMALLKQNNPRLAKALESDNLEDLSKLLKEQKEARVEAERLRIRMLTADPMDMEAQRLIAQEIENKNIDQNMELAMEHNPENFGSVVMLYIDCKVNGHKIKAFVDSGAQATIMSHKAAERCNIMRLTDKRFSGVAQGVGTQKIVGRVHLAQIQIGNDFLSSSFSILENQPMDMLLGLDMLKRHQCSIDLKNNVLVIGSTGTKTPFLDEASLPECAKQKVLEKDSGPHDIDEAIQASIQEHEEREINNSCKRSEDEEKRTQL